MESALRVLINLTHDDFSWCQALLSELMTISLTVRIVVTSQQQRAAASVRQGDGIDEDDSENSASGSCLDCLCLALGLLTNLVQAAEDASDTVRETGKCHS